VKSLNGPVSLSPPILGVELLADPIVLPRLPIFALITLYRSLISATSEVSNTFVTPDVSEVVTFLSFTSIPMLPGGSTAVISFENAITTERSLIVTEPLLSLLSSMKEGW